MATKDNQSLRGSVHVIIAAYSGIGSAVARSLHAQGATLVLAGRDPDKLAPLADEVGGEAVTVDATDFAQVEQCLQEAAAERGRVDGVLNCAGSIFLKPAHLTTADELNRVLATNLVSAFATVRAAAGVMRKTGGSIVLMSSGAATIGLGSHEAIAAAKAGVNGLMRSSAATYAAQGIRVNSIAPGLVDTPASERITANEASLNASLALHPLGRIGSPADIAAAICWLLSPASTWVTGQVIGVDGGLAALKTARPRRA